MKMLWTNAVLPMILSGLILFVNQFFGRSFIGWVESIAVVVFPVMLLLGVHKRMLRAMNPLLSRNLPKLCAQTPNSIIANHLTNIDVAVAVPFLRRVIFQDRFVPDLVVGVDRGGAIVGGMLAKLFNCPFSHIASSPEWRLSNPECSIDDGLKNSDSLDKRWRGKINNVLIVDDACRSGRTLETATKSFTTQCAYNQLQVKTATILYELRQHKTVKVDYACFNTYKTDLRLPWDFAPHE